MEKYSIVISTVTRNRPKMLANLYLSLSNMDFPDSVKIDFLIVENNAVSTLDSWLATIRSQIYPYPVLYLLETRIGISHARNCALDFAEQAGADFLVFVDDDEFVEPDWFKQLLAEQQRMDLDILGSPVRPKPFKPQLNMWQSLIWSGVEKNSVKAELRARKKWQENEADTIKVATGSWMGKLDFFRKTGLRFDSRLGLTGGEDWNLWLQAKELGARTGWAPDAIVYETVPCCRISFSYHFRRNRDHNASEFALLYRANRWQAIKQLPSKLLSRSWKLLSATVTLPFKGGQGLVSFAMALGGVAGLLQACCGKQTLHYSKTTGF
ncbi:hypothetical protein L614_000800001640 [Ochrobactrum sp. J50]|jgi:GT2 family glycosyltransferase|uniref:Glycosyltransferase family 2 protein n=1 Tax=Brucella pseudintermedia TaxID=370111 RepID=A0ABY5UBC7_9HYPH|nr:MULTISPECIES: glycosyltransferase family A protein [Brucella/Ochrobactrum group]MCO7725825.1 glycosyltransferase family 2 protein [Brucella intermedia]TWG95788.1 hypothetical protein L614_000800001640 [Ochrobactrum sp. J50]UWL60633.1 glycosyltransferase family 2 protein [Brucella pseudintermedia]WPM81245.1 glycosyltransferase family A protein [Brucella pseudintermedia]